MKFGKKSFKKPHIVQGKNQLSYIYYPTVMTIFSQQYDINFIGGTSNMTDNNLIHFSTWIEDLFI